MTLKPYAKYKDSGVEWLGQVPEHWDVAPIKRGYIVKLGKMLQPKSQTAHDLLVPYMRASNIQSNGIDISDVNEMWLSPAEIQNLKLFSGDLLVSEGGDVGRCALWRNEVENCYFQNSINRVRSSKSNSNTYLMYLIQSIKDKGAIDVICNKLSIAHLTAEKLNEIKISYPRYEEQTAIATYLDQETARIDELIAHKTRFIELLKEKRSALITHAVTKGLHPNVKMKDSGVEWLGQVPEHWEVKRLKFVATYQNSNVDKKTYDDQKLVRLCNYTDVYYNEFITDSMDFMEATASDSEVKSFSLEQGHIIITKDSEDPTDIGIPAIVAEPLFNVVCGYHLTIIRTTQDNCASFVFRVLQSHPTKAQFYVESPGITRFGLGQDTIGGLSFALPPIAEQTSIATYLDQETARIDEIIQLTEQSISLIKERRSALITAAVTGKIDVREQDKVGV